jgi:hypothetical protein
MKILLFKKHRCDTSIFLLNSLEPDIRGSSTKKFSLGPFTETKHRKFIATDTASVQLFFNIFATGIETFVIPWEQLLNTCAVEVCRLGLELLCDNHLRLSVILKTLTLTGLEFLEA